MIIKTTVEIEMSTMTVKRENWIDNIKIFACVLVAAGHFFQSMCTAGILSAGPLYSWFIRTIYAFHVPLFFICSGYVFQKYSFVRTVTSWVKHISKKIIILGIPYITFSLVTWLIKCFFANDVNSQVSSLWYDLVIHPMSPYWYLFALFFIFALTGTFSNRHDCYVGIAVALLLKFLSSYVDPYALRIVLSNQIWFVFGMALCILDVRTMTKNSVQYGLVLLGSFLLLSFVKWPDKLQDLASFILGMIACAAFVLLFWKTDRYCSGVAEYTMPIYLMHTIFAAGIRIVLLKIGIYDPLPHIIMGLTVSLVGPIISAEVMKMLRVDFLYQPGKYMKNKKG